MGLWATVRRFFSRMFAEETDDPTELREHLQHLQWKLSETVAQRDAALLLARRLRQCFMQPNDGSDLWFAHRDRLLSDLDALQKKVGTYDNARSG